MNGWVPGARFERCQCSTVCQPPPPIQYAADGLFELGKRGSRNVARLVRLWARAATKATRQIPDSERPRPCPSNPFRGDACNVSASLQQSWAGHRSTSIVVRCERSRAGAAGRGHRAYRPLTPTTHQPARKQSKSPQSARGTARSSLRRPHAAVRGGSRPQTTDRGTETDPRSQGERDLVVLVLVVVLVARGVVSRTRGGTDGTSASGRSMERTRGAGCTPGDLVGDRWRGDPHETALRRAFL